jgi:hypothetical protein
MDIIILSLNVYLEKQSHMLCKGIHRLGFDIDNISKPTGLIFQLNICHDVVVQCIRHGNSTIWD